MNLDQVKFLCELMRASRTDAEIRQARGLQNCKTLDELILRCTEVMYFEREAKGEFDDFFILYDVPYHIDRVTDHEQNKQTSNGN